MKVLKKKIIWFCIVFIVGGGLLAAGLLNGGNPEITSFGTALMVVSALKLLQFLRISKNKELMRKFEVQQNEERLIMIAGKSGHLALSISILCEIVAAISLMFMSMHDIATIVSYVAAGQTLLYLIVYVILCKKY